MFVEPQRDATFTTSTGLPTKSPKLTVCALMSLPESEWRLGAAVACAEEEVQSDSTAMVLVRPMVQSDSIGRWRIAGLATATRRATGVASLAPSLADDLSSIWKQWKGRKGAHTNRTDNLQNIYN